MTREEIIALAKQHGASAYTNRHYQGETYMTFLPEKLEAFFHAAQRAERASCETLCGPSALGIEQVAWVSVENGAVSKALLYFNLDEKIQPLGVIGKITTRTEVISNRGAV